MNTPKQRSSVETRQAEDKARFLKELREMPVVTAAARRAGLGRATVYRWQKEDKEFAAAHREAMREGDLLINDMSESQAITLIREKKWAAIRYWLDKRNPKFSGKDDAAEEVEYGFDYEQYL